MVQRQANAGLGAALARFTPWTRVGRALPEQVAATHRLDYLEDIATAMPEVRDWVATSGLTLDELASIQPGYPGPEVQHLMGWLKADKKDNYEWQAPTGEAMPADGPYKVAKDGLSLDYTIVQEETPVGIPPGATDADGSTRWVVEGSTRWVVLLSVALVFFNPSLRTRASFEQAVRIIGGDRVEVVIENAPGTGRVSARAAY